MSTYPYDIATSFTDSLYDPLVLYDTVANDVNIAPICIGHKVNGSDLEFHFVSALSPGEETVLDGIISSYVYTCPYIKNNFISATILNTTSEESYTLIAEGTYPGSNHTGPIFAIDVVAYVEDGGKNYDIQIINNDTNEIIAEVNYENTKPIRNTISETDLSNIPEEMSTISIYAKTGKKKKECYISQVLLWIGG